MNWFKNLKLARRMSLLISLLMLISFGIAVAYELQLTYKGNLGKGQAFAEQEAVVNSGKVQQLLDSGKQTLDNLNVTINTLRQGNQLSREQVISLLEAKLKSTPQLLGLYTIWEPNAFDGKDKQYVNKEGYDATGRLLPYVVRSGDKITVTPLHNYDKEGEGDWYLVPKDTKKPLLLDPYDYDGVTMTSLVVPILDDQGQFLGILGADFALNSLQDFIEGIKPLGGHSNLISSNGHYVENSENEKKNLKLIESKKIRDQLNKGKVVKENTDQYIHIYQPISITGLDDTYWTFELVIPKSVILKDYYDIQNASLIMIVVTLLVVMLVIILVVRSATKPIEHAVEVVKEIANGNLRAKIDAKYLNNDEVGQLGKSLNGMVDQLTVIFTDIRQSSEQVAATSEELTASAEENSRATEQIARATHELATGGERQVSSAQEATEIVGRVSTGMNEASHSMKHVSQLIEKGNESAQSGNKIVFETVDKMNHVQEKILSAQEVVNFLGRKSKEIDQIVTFITQISDQTNLLSLNAAIEAARAGEHGKGFAVVASEVRKLAEQSGKAAEEIRELIQHIQSETNRAVQSMNDSTSAMTDGLANVKISGESFKALADIMIEVQAQSEQVSEVVADTSQQSLIMVENINEMKGISEQASGNTHQLASSAEEQSASMEEIAAVADSLSTMSQNLQQAINRFTF
ncbi:methyl-accepting chemotaxis protein [Priestia koreensis]|uniref:methyl-accepting chemotaxis protein n=1 Tax=Priestia koreensis TaxID=284581 RepID=UPI0028F6CA05|nr:methyl-accepting chemotaxis protein [Priestia koreensis]